MTRAGSKIGGGFLALAAIWIGVYWLWEPSRSADVTFSGDPAAPPAGPDLASNDQPPDPASRPVHEPEPPPTAEAPPEQPASTSAEGQTPVGGVVPPQFRDYVVRGGDTFSSISERAYGTSRHAGAIAAANPFVSPTGLREGDVLRVPVDPENVQGEPVEGTEEAAPEPEFVEYVVVSGDTLSEIAQRFYGSLRYAEVIYNANRDTLSSMDDLQLGDVLRIPSPESVLGEGDR